MKDNQRPSDTNEFDYDSMENRSTDPFVRQQVEALYKPKSRRSSIFSKIANAFKRNSKSHEEEDNDQLPAELASKIFDETKTGITLPPPPGAPKAPQWNDEEPKKEDKPKKKRAAPKFEFGVDTAILGISTITFFTSLFFFFQDGMLSAGARANLVKVGDFSVSKNDVRRRVDAGLTWTPVNAPDAVYEGDSVFTGGESEASIKLEDGTILNVEPKSLVVIRTKGQNLEIALQYGSLQGKIAENSKQAIVLTQDGEEQELKTQAGTELRIVKAEDTKKTNVQVVTGKVEVKDRRSKAPPKIVKKDEFVELEAPSSEPAPAPVKKSKIALVSPSNGTMRWVPDDEPVTFNWKSEGPGILELSKSSTFNPVAYQSEPSQDTVTVSGANRPKGTFFWRVRPADGNGSPSSSQKLSYFADVPPSPVSPTEQQIFWLEDGKQSQDALVKWEDNVGSTKFKVEVARDVGFTNFVVVKEVNDSSLKVSNLATGDYFWRVMGLHPSRPTSGWSRTMSFSVREGTKTLTAPVIVKTKIDYTIPNTVLARTPASAVANGGGVAAEGIEAFEWTGVQSANSYEVEVATDANFEGAARLDVGKALSFAPQEVRPGAIYIRVRSKSKSGTMSPPSAVGRMEVKLPGPLLSDIPPQLLSYKTKAEADKARANFKLTWAPQAFADSYELEWGADVMFKQSKKFRVRDTKHEIAVSQARVYAARVRSLDSAGRPITPYSDVQLTNYQKDIGTPIAKPVAEAPRQPASPTKEELEKAEAAKAAAAALKAKQAEIAKLEAEVAKAEAAKLAKAKAEADKVARAKAEAEAAAKAKLELAQNAKLQAALLAQQSKELDDVGGLATRALAPPALREPRPDSSLVSLENVPTFVSFKWKAVADASRYTIQISQSPDFSTIVSEAKVTKTTFLYEKRLPKGKVYWRVRAYTDSGWTAWSKASDMKVIYQ